MANVLAEIVAHKRREIAALRERSTLADLERAAAAAGPSRGFVQALRSARNAGRIGLIAEVKKASPSAGLIREDFDPVRIAETYEQHGAACISVLTDERYFQGHLDHLRFVRQAVDVPLLRKDFILDPVQILEARAAGADCILLIAECLSSTELRELHAFAADAGLETLIEIYEPENLDRVLELAPPLVGINNRNLRTFVTDLDHTLQLVKRVPAETLLVSESGIRTRNDVERLHEAGVAAILVGETLMRSDDIGAKVEELVGPLITPEGEHRTSNIQH
ncbi:MAG: indole-3-glycerol phosphate synthase TrpC [Planctomycetes bacterium]|nr:indole-3-glycerol phosphate synthase TrpC [Planctomycetota bacterium]